MLVFPVRTYPWKAFIAITALTVALPLLAIALVLIYAQAIASWLVILVVASAIGFLLSVNVGLTALIVYVATRNEVTVRDATLHLKTSEYHERVPLDSITAIEIIDLATRPALARTRRRSGFALPGFRVGWFHAGDDVLFVLRATRRQLLYIQTDRRFSVLLGVANPHDVAATLRAPATARAH